MTSNSTENQQSWFKVNATWVEHYAIATISPLKIFFDVFVYMCVPLLPMCEVLFLCVCLYRNPIAVKRPNSAMKQQRKDSPGLQHRGAGPGGRGQANPKPERPGFRDTRGTKSKDDKVGSQQLIGG